MDCKDTKKTEIYAWLRENVKDYANGVVLAGRYGSKAAARIYAASKPQYKLGDLTAYLRHLVGLRPEDAVPSPVSVGKAAASAPVCCAVTVPAAVAPPLPVAIVRAKDKLREVWMKMNECQERLAAIGSDNSDATKAQRVAIMEERAPWIDAYIQLYEMKETYFAMPIGEAVVPSGLVELLDKLDGKATLNVAKEDYAQYPDVKLLKVINATRQKITRRKNQLEYQQDVPLPGGAKRPMPDSPKRRRIEADLVVLRRQFADLIREKEVRGI